MLRNNLLYEDNYTYFEFNNKSSKDYQLYIVNEENKLTIPLDRQTNIEYASPKYAEGQYLLGVTHSQRSIPLSLVAYGLNRTEINDMFKWISVGATGILEFYFMTGWKYNVVINKITNPIMLPIDKDNYILSFDIEFGTLENTKAQKTIYTYKEGEALAEERVGDASAYIELEEVSDTTLIIYFKGLYNNNYNLIVEFCPAANNSEQEYTFYTGDTKIQKDSFVIKDTGQKITFNKNNNVAISKSVEGVSSIAKTTHCPISPLPSDGKITIEHSGEVSRINIKVIFYADII